MSATDQMRFDFGSSQCLRPESRLSSRLSREPFPVGSCTRTLVGKASVTLSRVDIETFHIDVRRSFVPYAWQFIDEARRELALTIGND